MYSVNLLPLQYQKNEKNQAVKNRLIYTIALLLVVLFSAYRLVISLVNQSYDQHTTLAADNAKLAQLVESLKSDDPSLADTGAIETIISQLTKNNKDFENILVLIANSATDDIVVTQYTMQKDETGYACIIQANALSYESVSTWIQGLSELEGFGEITLSNINKSNIDETETESVQFELRIPIL